MKSIHFIRCFIKIKKNLPILTYKLKFSCCLKFISTFEKGIHSKIDTVIIKTYTKLPKVGMPAFTCT